MEYREYWEELDLSIHDFDMERFLRREQESERELEHVEELLEERKQIHSENVAELESKLDWYLERLEKAYKRGKEVDKVERLKPKIEEFYLELRKERRQRWRDKIELEMELREVQRALEEVEDESDLFDMLG